MGVPDKALDVSTCDGCLRLTKLDFRWEVMAAQSSEGKGCKSRETRVGKPTLDNGSLRITGDVL